MSDRDRHTLEEGRLDNGEGEGLGHGRDGVLGIKGEGIVANRH